MTGLAEGQTGEEWGVVVSGADVWPYAFLLVNAKSMELERSSTHFYAFLDTHPH